MRFRPELETLEGRVLPSKNIVLIVTDDQRFDTMNAMPFTKEFMVDGGAEFENAYVTSPVCCPSRVSFLTGEYISSHGVMRNTDTALYSGEDSLPTWLDDAGYETALFGKYLNGYRDPDPPPGWDQWHAFHMPSVHQHGGYYNFILNNNGNQKLYRDKYSTNVLKRQAVNFIKNNNDDPFFVSFWPRAPHGPATPAPKDMNRPVNLPRLPSYNEADVSDKPPWIRRAPRWGADHDADSLYINQVRSLAAVDRAVREIYQEVARQGEANDTVFIFTSDNGFIWGEHRLSGKFYPYEEALRVPLFIRDGVDKPKQKAIALNIDVAPTILEYAGLPIPSSVQGRSLVNPAPRDIFFIELYQGKPQHNFRGVHGTNWVYIAHHSGFEEFYDLKTDPFQLRNLAKKRDLTAYRSLVASRWDS